MAAELKNTASERADRTGQLQQSGDVSSSDITPCHTTTDDQKRYASQKTLEQRKRARIGQLVDSANTDDA